MNLSIPIFDISSLTFIQFLALYFGLATIGILLYATIDAKYGYLSKPR